MPAGPLWLFERVNAEGELISKAQHVHLNDLRCRPSIPASFANERLVER